MRSLKYAVRWALGTLNLVSGRPVGLQTVRRVGGPAAVVFVHGFAGDARGTWRAFPDLLCGEAALGTWDVYAYGYTSSLRPDLPTGVTGDPDLKRLSRSLRTEAAVPPLSEYQAVAFVAHSMGGLVVQRALVEDPELAGRVTHVFLLGTPSGGKRLAGALGFLKRQVRGMSPRELGALRERWDDTFDTQPGGAGRHPFVLAVIDGETDTFVSSESALGAFDDRYLYTTLGDHGGMVKPSGADDRTFRLVADRLAGGVLPRSPVDSARVAVEKGEFHRAIGLFGPHADELDPQALVQYAIALDEVGRREEAIGALRAHPEGPTDVLGTLGGRLKRRWLAGRRAGDAEEALGLYGQGYAAATETGDYAQAYYHAVNLGFLALVYSNDRSEAEAWAERALSACERAPEGGADEAWRRAARAEAHLLLGDDDEAVRGYATVLEVEPDPREVRSAYYQAMRIAEHRRARSAGTRLRGVFGLPFPPP